MIVLEVAEAVSLTQEDLHFGVEALGDSMVASESPHGHDLLGPGVQGVGELNQLRQPSLLQDDTDGGASARAGSGFWIRPCLTRASS